MILIRIAKIRLSFYLEKSEDFKEAQINMIAQYVDYSGE